MDEQSFERRKNMLLSLLDMQPLEHRLVSALSGGQKRRASFAVAMIHDPQLLILDEPTVGVDPLLRAKLWEHLVTLARETGVSIIITTHYIEEARQVFARLLWVFLFFLHFPPHPSLFLLMHYLISSHILGRCGMSYARGPHSRAGLSFRWDVTVALD